MWLHWVGTLGLSLLVQLGLGAGGVCDKLLILEPQGNLHLSVLGGVTAVDDVPVERPQVVRLNTHTL